MEFDTRAAQPNEPSACTHGDANDEEQTILAYLTDAISPFDREKARTARDAFVSLLHAVSAENGLIEDELADRLDAARRTA
ncbi:MAG: hypothetical protein M3Y58_00865 [Chloroflexota bacterium]|nr:hypothetical protein [Chloroflexota bacterium]